MFVTPAYAQAAGAGATSAITQFIPLILIFAIMYFLMIRPQQKRAKQHREMVANLKKGDQIITQGGILGKVSSVRDDEVEVEIAQGVRIRIVRSTVAQVLNKTEPVAANS
ncbi:preprotein translocase subunit YajC [Paracoccus sp. 1_MG-2023]|uniref:preprotein translocase subunit YajC n=1 Tax=unclassified Paracoccus (in: a-proteobacteria) TaxID=2688777 RepID=UPI001C082077|nr:MULTISPECIES: preprotein translocase subunit YajC [unclassified Paracoccus (in: a-proteobacteria)]MBU2959004.1 preprotein translocase subunit YajC [Paracoccus sp. C2R09]MDO6668976.1 preprotein translocase subunit YajC [Paracoccus sp. 1_MG-2023]